MFRFSRLLFGFCLLVSGCVSVPPVDVSLDVVPAVSRQLPYALRSVSVMKAEGVPDKDIQAGDLVLPLWEQSLRSAIQASAIFNPSRPGLAKVVVKVRKIDQPLFGVEMKTSAVALYEIYEDGSESPVYSEVVESVGVVPGDFAYMGYVRAQESVNRAVRENILGFLKEFDKHSKQ